MSDFELIEMHDHPQDYEPWAWDLGNAELQRRRLAAEQMTALRAENEAEAPLVARAVHDGGDPLMKKFAFILFTAVFGLIAVIVRSC